MMSLINKDQILFFETDEEFEELHQRFSTLGTDIQLYRITVYVQKNNGST